MFFSELVSFYEKIEVISGRIEMTNLLVELLRQTPPKIIDKVVYLTLGEVYPPFMGLELGVADRLALRAVKLASGMSEREIERAYKEQGDVGLTGERMLVKRSQETLFAEQLKVEDVYSTLEKIARAIGEGAMETKVQILSGLLASAQPKEAKYILRIVTGKMRLGIADMTILDALAILFGGGKETRELFERAYNITSDIGFVAKTAAIKGIEGLRNVRITIGRPIRPMLAERLSSAEEILQKLGDKCLAEYKYDGLRAQIALSKDKVLIFSRRLENITAQFPDVAKMTRDHIKAEEAIVEGEIVGIDPEIGGMLPFQETMHRRRKYEIEKYAEEVPVACFLFDVLYVDGNELLNEPLWRRRNILEKIVDVADRFRLTHAIEVIDEKALEKFFLQAIEEGCEGLVAKGLNTPYEAGARGFKWIKYKRSYVSKLTDTLDLTIVGVFHGRGKRAGLPGAVLLAAYNPEKDQFETVCKCGTGFSDEDLGKLKELLEPLKSDKKPARLFSIMEPDFWVEPKIVLEVLGDEITLSPLHTCDFGLIKQDAGVAIRFPRFTGRFRFDKSPEDSTTVEELVEMYKRQLKKLGTS